jgi:hypothetical protein
MAGAGAGATMTFLRPMMIRVFYEIFPQSAKEVLEV